MTAGGESRSAPDFMNENAASILHKRLQQRRAEEALL